MRFGDFSWLLIILLIAGMFFFRRYGWRWGGDFLGGFNQER